jgi:phosphotransferase system enzyme I (PtsI)
VSQILHGLGVSPGIATGLAYLLHAESLPVVPTPVPPERVEEEIQRFERARARAGKELEAVKGQVLEVLGDHYAGIIEAQLLILDDPSLVAQTIQRIRMGRVTARWALKEVVGEFTRRFGAMDDAYLRERGGDLSDVHRRLQRLLRGEQTQQALPEGPRLVVAHSVVPSDAVALAGKGVVGLATDVGGRTSHTAILAQALSVPAVAGLRDISQRVSPGDQIIIDGDSGEVQLLPSEVETAKAEQRRRAWLVMERDAATAARELPSTTRDGVEMTIRANIEFPSEVELALRFGARGVGLYRSEFLFLTQSPQLPSEEEHYHTYRQIAEQVAPHPAIIRTLDLGGEKYFHEVLGNQESNPVLGLRAVRLCLQRLDIFRPQLRGLLRAATQENLQIMLPLVTTPDEILQVRRLLAEEAEQLRSEGVAVRGDVPLGIMVEVPAAAIAADVLAREADFFSLGTNDLIQYSLAVDRGNEAVSYLYQPLHPGVLRMVRFVADSARRQGIPVAMCGEMAADVAAIGLLIGLGLRELSVQPRSVAAVRRAVSGVDSREAEEWAERQLDLPSGVWRGQETAS